MDKKRTLMAGVALFGLALAAALPFAPSIIAFAATATANFTISPPLAPTIGSVTISGGFAPAFTTPVEADARVDVHTCTCYLEKKSK